ncbi:FecR family protein [Inquilinus sp.]|jgi:transmembrane sensor|uniref:FecR family protein n=1 Tax=Inquilinus sp. TaxID=1932117 RepID=UPI00378517CD
MNERMTEAQRDMAATWLVRRQAGPLSPADETAFRSWIAADSRHAEALGEAEALWRQLEEPGRRLAGRFAAVRPRRRGRLAALLRPLVALPALGAAVCTALALWVFAPTAIVDLAADAVTARGEIRDLALPDGSVLHLAADSAVGLDFGDGRRRVELRRGEAFFEIRPGLSAPFTVAAGDARIRVVGTRFNVGRFGEDAEVTVAEGVVEVAAGSATVRLTAGQQVAAENGALSAVRTVDPADASAWMHGRLVFHRQPLAHVVAALQRQGPGRILLSGDRLAQMRVSGTFPAGDPDGALAALSGSLGLGLSTVTPWVRILQDGGTDPGS